VDRGRAHRRRRQRADGRPRRRLGDALPAPPRAPRLPGAGFHIAPRRIHGLPVTELQFTGPARLRNAYNIFTWVGTTAYRIECHHRAEPAAAMELQRACHQALLSLAVRPALAAAPGRTRAS
jgi:hypothetical protein